MTGESDDFAFDYYCGFTCVNGSEKRLCPCSGWPGSCEMEKHLEYLSRKMGAQMRMLREIAKTTETACEDLRKALDALGEIDEEES